MFTTGLLGVGKWFLFVLSLLVIAPERLSMWRMRMTMREQKGRAERSYPEELSKESACEEKSEKCRLPRNQFSVCSCSLEGSLNLCNFVSGWKPGRRVFVVVLWNSNNPSIITEFKRELPSGRSFLIEKGGELLFDMESKRVIFFDPKEYLLWLQDS